MINKFITRDESNVVNGVYARPQDFMEEPYEKLPEDDPEVIAYYEGLVPTADEAYDRALENNKLLKQVVKALNSVGSFTSDHSVLSNANLKALILSQ